MCTDLLIVSEGADGRDLVVNARSQEFATALGYRLVLRKKGVMVQVTQPRKDSKLDNPIQVDLCTSKYDYMGIIMTTPKDPWTAVSTSVFDGMNSAGLSAGALNFGGSVYQAKSEKAGTKNLFVGFLVDWLLSNYATCKEVQAAFRTDALRVVADAVGFETPEDIAYVQRFVHIHFAVHDANGNSLVIEFVDGEAQITENPIGVLTNLPIFSWHLTNLGLYGHLSNYSTHEPIKFGEVSYAPAGSVSPEPLTAPARYRSTGIPGMGDGLTGIPGDYLPTSRFVRTAYLKQFAVSPKTANEAVNQAFHLLNAVDIVEGASAERAAKPEGHDLYDTAQIIVVKDLINKVFYLRMYESPMPYFIAFDDFNKFAPDCGADQSKGVQISIPTETLALPIKAHSVQ
jgi:choloylglycine hydrolase